MRAVWYDRQGPAAQVLQAGELEGGSPLAQAVIRPDPYPGRFMTP